LPNRRRLIPALLLLLLSDGVASAAPEPVSHAAQVARAAAGAVTATAPYRDGEILVRLRAATSPRAAASVHARHGATVIGRFATVPSLDQVRLPAGTSVDDAVRAYASDPDVLYAEPNYLVHAVALPNDPRFGEMWDLHNTGQSGGVPDADIDAPEAWDLTTGDASVVVAVIDTGMDYTHPDLAPNMFHNTPECVPNGLDDDGNGWVDDCYGIDTFYDDGDPSDAAHDDHATHVAGTIGARGNNAIGVTGINWDVRILSCKFLDRGSGATADAVRCLDYVALMKDRGVNIVATNNSWGGTGFSQALLDAIDAQRARGILFVAAAGNAGTDSSGFFPSGFYLPNVVTVAATTRTDTLATYSNRGPRIVHLGAPGSEILSTIPSVGYAAFNGTSMAAPHVTGVAALAKAQDPGRDWRAIRNLLLAGGDPIPALTDTTVTGRRLNAHGTLACYGTTVLARLRPVRDLVAVQLGAGVDLAALHIDCENPAGTVDVTVQPGGATVTLTDDGTGFDQEAGDGVYAGTWTAASAGTYTASFPNGDTVEIRVGSEGMVSPEARDGDHFAWTLATSGTKVIAGEPNDDTGATDAGSAHILDAATGATIVSLHHPAAAAFDNFGVAVAIDGDLALVGAPYHTGTLLEEGAAYLFDATTGALLQTFTSPTPYLRGWFGFGVAFAGGKPVVGAPYDDLLAVNAGAAYMFDPTTGALLHTFTNPTPAIDEAFGATLAGLGTRLVVGAPADGPPEFPGLHAGIVHLFEADPGSLAFGDLIWSKYERIGDGVSLTFGYSVGVLGDDVLVGDPNAFIPRPADAPEGAPYVLAGGAWILDGATGDVVAGLFPPSARDNMYFGFSVGGAGAHAVVGAPVDSSAVPGAGHAYVFEAATGLPVRRLASPQPGTGDFYGLAVAGTGSDLLIGAPNDDTTGTEAGAIFRVTLPPPLDRSKCYKAKLATGAVKLPVQQMTLTDDVESKITLVQGATSACNPASQSGSAIVDGAAHLTCHKIKDAKGQPKLAAQNLRVFGSLGTQQLTVKKALSLCLASGRNGGPIPSGLDHYKCYQAKITPGTAKPERQTIAIQDGFETKQMVVANPIAYCAPVQLDGSSLTNAETSLTCYQIKDASGQLKFPGQGLTASSVLGTESLVAAKATTLCVPTQRLP
jgi:subtilisin family serine protease